MLIEDRHKRFCCSDLARLILAMIEPMESLSRCSCSAPGTIRATHTSAIFSGQLQRRGLPSCGPRPVLVSKSTYQESFLSGKLLTFLPRNTSFPPFRFFSHAFFYRGVQDNVDLPRAYFTAMKRAMQTSSY